jgi:hypothetical protein
MVALVLGLPVGVVTTIPNRKNAGHFKYGPGLNRPVDSGKLPAWRRRLMTVSMARFVAETRAYRTDFAAIGAIGDIEDLAGLASTLSGEPRDWDRGAAACNSQGPQAGGDVLVRDPSGCKSPDGKADLQRRPGTGGLCMISRQGKQKDLSSDFAAKIG